MGELRFNPITGDPVILSTARADRPGAWSEDSPRDGRDVCPFCPGHESETPPEIERIGANDWSARVVPNKYPAIFCLGKTPHEVIIDSPEHDLPFEEMKLEQLCTSVDLLQRRARDHSDVPGRRYVSVFRNEGRGAGQSIPHPHSQLLAIDFVPPRISRELEAFVGGPCPMCAIVRAEVRSSELLIDRRGSLALFSPRAARFPFEMWISDERHVSNWTEASSVDLAGLLLSAVTRLRVLHPGAHFNLGVITSPVHTEGANRFHWYVEVTPRLTNVAGFELATGGWINIESPERAAERLRLCPVRQG